MLGGIKEEWGAWIIEGKKEGEDGNEGRERDEERRRRDERREQKRQGLQRS